MNNGDGGDKVDSASTVEFLPTQSADETEQLTVPISH